MVGTGLEWELQRAIHHLPLGRRLHCVVGMGASGRSKRNGDLARMASGVVAAGKYRTVSARSSLTPSPRR